METGVTYEFTYDQYGNNTSVSVKNGSGKITSSVAYTSDGNRLVSATDALGKVTAYSYNANTNLLEWVKYPNDTDSSRTEYTYDSMYRLAKAESEVGSQTLSATYTYTWDYAHKQLTNYVTNGMLVYNPRLDLCFGGKITQISPGKFTKIDKDGEGEYLIWYWYDHDGVLFYDYIYYPSDRELKTYAAISLVTALVSIGISVFTGFPTPTPIPLPA